MPIVDVELVCTPGAGDAEVSARSLADALGHVFGSPPGSTWVRLHALARGAYAENGVELGAAAGPAFVTVLHAHPPSGAELAAEVTAITHAAAACLRLPPDSVHVEYAPSGAGRLAFGGRIVT
jgi:phenylpyruvate tautomerase PptA (4-oxalocrotonate tautomerase family)